MSLVPIVLFSAAALLIVGKLLGARRSPEIVAAMRAALGEAGLVLDVRTPQEFAGGAIDGALNIPLQQLQGRLGELGDRRRPILVCCASGMRSRVARGILTGAGFERVMDLGAWRNWHRTA